MSQAMTAVMASVHAQIPPQLLKLAFPDPYGTSIDALIQNEVIVKRVLIDTNLYSGKNTRIPLLPSYRMPTSYPANFAPAGMPWDCEVYQIPPDACEGYQIAAVLGLRLSASTAGFDVMPYSMGLGTEGNSVATLATGMLRSRTLVDAIQTPHVVLLGNNIVRVTPRVFEYTFDLDCLISFDAEYTNLDGGMIAHLQPLVVAAVKQYIYTQLIIAIDQNQVQAGQVIGKVREIVESYSTAGEEYDTALTTFRGHSMLSPDQNIQLLSYML